MGDEERDTSMDKFDVVVLGTGLKESILSGLMSSVCGKKVLHLDRNSYYGGEAASLTLDQLFEQFKDGAKPKESLGRSREYCVDLCPKFIMACGDLVKILLLTKVTDYLEFKSVAGSYVYKNQKLYKVPATAKEALGTSLLGMFEKRRFKSFLGFCSEFEVDDPKTHKPDALKMTAAQLFKHYDISPEAQVFTGHAMGLFLDDTYLERPAIEMITKIKLYAYSVTKYGNSPYIYPKWGLGGLPEGFSRRCAVHGGVYMLNVEHKPDFIEEVVYDGDGHVSGVKGQGQTAACKQLIADPSYFIGTNKIKQVGKVARCICILSAPIPNTTNADSAQIIIPGGPVGRKSDVYVCMTSFVHNVASAGKYIAVVSTNVETDNPENEIQQALKLLGKIDEKFFWVSDFYEPCNDPAKDGCFITSGYDATTHFSTCTDEVLKYYERLTGGALDLNISADIPEP